jgi:DNA-binding ferritin-like protein
MLSTLLSQLTALAQYMRFFHWKVKGKLSYQDHLLAERLYNETEALIDGVAEKSVGLFGAESIDAVEDAQAVTELLTSWKALRADHSLPAVGLKAVKDVIESITALKHEQEAKDELTEGLDNLLQGICDTLESHVYLLTQRTAEEIESKESVASEQPADDFMPPDHVIEELKRLRKRQEQRKENRIQLPIPDHDFERPPTPPEQEERGVWRIDLRASEAKSTQKEGCMNDELTKQAAKKQPAKMTYIEIADDNLKRIMRVLKDLDDAKAAGNHTYAERIATGLLDVIIGTKNELREAVNAEIAFMTPGRVEECSVRLQLLEEQLKTVRKYLSERKELEARRVKDKALREQLTHTAPVIKPAPTVEKPAHQPESAKVKHTYTTYSGGQNGYAVEIDGKLSEIPKHMVDDYKRIVLGKYGDDRYGQLRYLLTMASKYGFNDDAFRALRSMLLAEEERLAKLIKDKPYIPQSKEAPVSVAPKSKSVSKDKVIGRHTLEITPDGAVIDGVKFKVPDIFMDRYQEFVLGKYKDDRAGLLEHLITSNWRYGYKDDEDALKALKSLLREEKKVTAMSVAPLLKIAYSLDQKGLYSEADQIEELVKTLATRVGLMQVDVLQAAQMMDDLGCVEAADVLDGMVKQAKESEPPKAWATKAMKRLKAKYPKRSAKALKRMVSMLWSKE